MIIEVPRAEEGTQGRELFSAEFLTSLLPTEDSDHPPEWSGEIQWDGKPTKIHVGKDEGHQA